MFFVFVYKGFSVGNNCYGDGVVSWEELVLEILFGG